MQQIMSHLSAIKKDMILLEKSEFSTLRHNYEVIAFNLLSKQILQSKQLLDNLSSLSMTSPYFFHHKFLLFV